MSKTLKIALAKGTLFTGAVEFLKSKGINVHDIDEKRKLIKSTDIDGSKNYDFDKIEALLVRGHDVPFYVESGAADLGVVGVDVVKDSGCKVMELKDLDYGHCRLCVCGRDGEYKSLSQLPNYVKIATTFPNISKEFFTKRGLDVEIINLYGSVELGPLTGLSDVIVDLVASGKTLKENKLEVIDEIMPCTARLITNEVSFKFFRNSLLELAS